MAVHKDLDTAFPIFLQLSEQTKGSLLQWISGKLEQEHKEERQTLY